MKIIKASDIKPGMVVEIIKDDVCLVTAIKRKCVQIQYTGFYMHDACDGALVSWTHSNKKVKVIRGKKRTAFIKEIAVEVRRGIGRREEGLNSIYLIQAMDNQI